MAYLLTKEDVERLLADPSPAGRADTATKIATEVQGSALTGAERQLAEDILRILTRDISLLVRKALSESLAAATEIPHDIAMTLASDVDGVAFPILRGSSVFSDEDLLTILNECSSTKQEAIAGRAAVSDTVSTVLIEKGSETAIAVLMANEGADITDAGYARALDRFGESAMVTQPMARREKLPTLIVERLITLVSETLRDHLLTHQQLPADTTLDLILQARERATAVLVVGSNSAPDLEDLVMQLAATHRLTPSLILRVLCLGDIGFFEAALSHLAKVPLPNARVLIHDEGGMGLKSLYERAGLPLFLLPAIRTAMDVLRATDYTDEPDDRERRRRRILERILTQYDELDGGGDMEYLLDRLIGISQKTAA